MVYIENVAKCCTVGQICLAGDFNERVKDHNDFIIQDDGDDIETID